MSNALLPNLVEDKSLVWQLTLLDMLYTPVAVLQYENLNFNKKFDDYDELSFTVPRYIYDRLEKKHIDNPSWFKIKAGMVVQLDVYEEMQSNWKSSWGSETILSERFSIQQPSFSESVDNNNKQFSCVALHQILFNKIKLRGYNDTRKLIEPNTKGLPLSQEDVPIGPEAINAKENLPYKPIPHEGNSEGTYKLKDNTQGGILDYILDYLLPDWGVAHYDKALLDIAQQNKINSEANAKFDEIARYWQIWGDQSSGTIQEDCPLDGIWSRGELYDEVNNLITTYMVRGTEADRRLLFAQWQYFHTKYKASTAAEFFGWCDEDFFINGMDLSIEAIKKEPLKGSLLISYAEQAIVAIQDIIRTFSEAKYTESGTEKMSDICLNLQSIARTILEEFIEPLSFYKSATGSVPYRSLQLDTTLVDVFKRLEENYLCVFEFDNVKKLIFIYSRDDEAVDKQSSLIITPENIMTDIQYQATTDQVTTRLYPKGKDDIQVGGHSINGMNYVDNFTYYIENSMMPSSLAEKVKRYTMLLDDIKKFQMAWDSWEIRGVEKIYYKGGINYFQTEKLNILAYLARDTEEDGSTPHTPDPEAVKFLQENLLISIDYYDGNVIAPKNDTLKSKHNLYTLKSIQDKIIELEGQLSVCQGYARQWQITNESAEPTEGEQEEGIEDSWWDTSSRTAIIEAKDASLTEIENEMGIYLSKAPEDYDDGESAVMVAFWDLESDSANDTSYISKNINIFQNNLIIWQRNFQYENIKILNIIEEDSQYSWSSENLFTKKDLDNLRNFIYEEDINWNTISTADSLYLYASLYLEYKKKIPVTIDLGLIDILSNYRYQFDWNKIMDVGSKIYIKFQDFQLDYDIYKLMSYSYSISSEGSRDLKMTLSNSYELTTLMNQLVNDVWAYTYKQLQDISKYKKTWEEFMAKQDALLSQGENIYADVTSIVDNAGKTIIGGSGLTISSTHYNSLRKNADGYYVRDKTISDGKIDSETQKTKKYISDHIIFDGATVTQSTDSNGETTLTISGMGGGGGSANTGLPRYYSAPYFSTSLNILDARREPPKTTIGEKDYVFYQEVTENQEYIWYQAELNKISGEEEDPPDSKYGYEVTQATDQNDKSLYWIGYTKAEDQSGQTIIDVDNCCYMTTEEPTEYKEETKVMIYKVDDSKKLEIFRLEQAEGTHLPRLIWGLGSGVGDNDKCIIEKVTHGLNAYIQTNEDNNKVRGLAIRHRNAGDNITALNGLYQIRNNGTTVIDDNLYPIPVCHFTTDIETVGNDIEQGDLIYVYQ